MVCELFYLFYILVVRVMCYYFASIGEIGWGLLFILIFMIFVNCFNLCSFFKLKFYVVFMLKFKLGFELQTGTWDKE